MINLFLVLGLFACLLLLLYSLLQIIWSELQVDPYIYQSKNGRWGQCYFCNECQSVNSVGLHCFHCGTSDYSKLKPIMVRWVFDGFGFHKDFITIGKGHFEIK